MSNKSRNNYSKKEADKDNILRRTEESFFINQNKKHNIPNKDYYSSNKKRSNSNDNFINLEGSTVKNLFEIKNEELNSDISALNKEPFNEIKDVKTNDVLENLKNSYNGNNLLNKNIYVNYRYNNNVINLNKNANSLSNDSQNFEQINKNCYYPNSNFNDNNQFKIYDINFYQQNNINNGNNEFMNNIIRKNEEDNLIDNFLNKYMSNHNDIQTNKNNINNFPVINPNNMQINNMNNFPFNNQNINVQNNNNKNQDNVFMNPNCINRNNNNFLPNSNNINSLNLINYAVFGINSLKNKNNGQFANNNNIKSIDNNNINIMLPNSFNNNMFRIKNNNNIVPNNMFQNHQMRNGNFINNRNGSMGNLFQ